MPYISADKMQAIEDLVARRWDGQGGPQSALRKLQQVFRGEPEQRTAGTERINSLPAGKASKAIESATVAGSIASRFSSVIADRMAELRSEVEQLQHLASMLGGTVQQADQDQNNDPDHPADTTTTMFPRGTGRTLATRSVRKDGTKRKRRVSRQERERRSAAMRESWERRKAAQAEAERAARRDVRKAARR